MNASFPLSLGIGALFGSNTRQRTVYPRPPRPLRVCDSFADGGLYNARNGWPLQPPSLLCPEFQLSLVLLQERLQFVSMLQEPDPLLVVKRHGEPSEALNAHTAFFADLEHQAGRLPACGLRFEFRDPRQQFFSGWLGHCSLLRYSASQPGRRRIPRNVGPRANKRRRVVVIPPALHPISRLVPTRLPYLPSRQ